MAKRKNVGDDLTLSLYNKKIRNEVVLISSREKAVVHSDMPRTSGLLAPIMAMEGHQGEIYTVKFRPDGQYLASSGYDRMILIWKVYGECENVGMMTGHTGAVMEMHFSTDGAFMYTASTDNTLGLWDLEAGVRIKKLKGLIGRGPVGLQKTPFIVKTPAVKAFNHQSSSHASFVNTCHPARRGPMLVCSGSDDCTIRLWDPRKREPTTKLNSEYQVTAVSFSDTAEQVFSGGIDNDIKVWDLRQNSVLYKLKGHTDTTTGLTLSPDGSYLLSNAMDNNLRIWDVRAFAPQERCVKIFAGHQHNFEKNLLRCAWSSDGSKISAGSADRFVYIWDTTSRRVLYKLPGHNGSVNDVDFHPKEPIILSGSSDKQLYMGEIEG